MKHSWGAVLLLGLCSVLPAYAQQTPVYVSYGEKDIVGSRLVYALRERLRASHGLKLVDSESDSFIQIRLVTVDPDDNSASTVYSAVITLTQLGNSSAKIYWTNLVGVCGSNRVVSCADGLAANIDNTATTIREALIEKIRQLK